MKFPVRLLWDMIGDAFEGIFHDDVRRPIDLLWQTYSRLSGETLNYVDLYKRSRNIFEVDVHAPWGTFTSRPELVDTTSQVDGLVLGHRDGTWIALTDCNEVIPIRGKFKLFDSSIPYTAGDTEEIQSDCRVSSMTTSFKSEPWDIEDNPSFVFGPNTTLDGSERWEDIGSPAIVAQSDGLLMRPQWSNWSVLQDNFYYSGAQDWEQIWRLRVDKWETVDTFTRSISINSFGDSGPNFEVRMEDTGTTIEVSSGMFAKTKYVTLTFSGSTITRETGSFLQDGFRPDMVINVLNTDSNDGSYTITDVTTTTITVTGTFTSEDAADASLTNELEIATGDTTGWREILETADTNNPLYVEFLIRYTASSAEMYSEVWFNDEVATQTNTYSISPGRRQQHLDVFNQINDVQIIVEWVAAKSGQLWESDQTLSFSTDIGTEFAFVYQVPEPLTNSSRIQWEPYDLTPIAEVSSQTSTLITLDIDENFKDYAPEFARIEKDDDYLIGELNTQTGGTVSYDIVQSSEPGVTLIGEVNLRPWYLDSTEFEWIETSLFSTDFPIPFEDRDCFFIDTEAEELDLYNRYGTLLQMPKRADSKPYLDALRGMKFGLLSHHTPDHTSRGIGILLGLPYANNTGFIEDISRVTDSLGGALWDNVIIGNRVHRVDPFWKDGGHLLPVGSFVEKLTPIVTSVTVYDWKTNIDLIQERIDDIWKTWGTFLVQVPASIGLNTTKVGDLIRYLDRSKSIHTDFIVEYIDEENEDLYTDTLDDIETAGQEIFAHTVEDMTFDDHGEVVLNALNYQTINGEDYSEEYQIDEDLTLDIGESLDFFESLDSKSLTVFDVKKILLGELTMGGNTWPDYPGIEYNFRNQGIDLKRDLNADETAASFSKVTLRTSDPNDNQDYFYRPYSLCFPFTGASPQFSVRDGGGTLITYHTQAYEDVTPAVSVDLHDAYIDSSNLVWFVGNDGAIWETTDYGENWSDVSIATTDEFNATHRFWAVGTNSIAYERVSGTWTSRTITASTVAFQDIFWIDSNTGWAVANNGTDCESYKTTDGGTNWDAAVSIATATQVTAVHFADSTNGWASTDDGLYRTDDGGATWSQVFGAGTVYNGVHAITSDIIIAIDNATNGNIVRSTDGTTATPSFTTVETLTSNQFNDVHFMNSSWGTAVGTGGNVYHSYDGGVNWESQTITAEEWSGVHTKAPWLRIVVGPAAGTEGVNRWR